ncbi:MAG: Amidohydrolase [Deltaproteobacteria bacterium]|nr:Amidohydrolase [Deltaproteobacteria bacterium]
MAKNGFKAMDSDMHVFEPADLWQRYIDKKYLDRAPQGLNRSFRDLGVEVEGKVLPIPRNPENPALAKYRHDFFQEKYGDAGKRNFDGVSQLQAMDKEGLDIAFLFPTRALTVLGIDGLDPDFASAIARAYNDWLHDFAQSDPKRMFGVAMVAPHDISGSIEEIRRTAKEYGFRGIFIRPNHVNNKKWSDPYYDPLWAECEKLNLPVGFHEAGRVYLPQPAFSHICSTFSMFNTFGFPFANMLACGDMIFGGVMERFPKLKVAFLEGNCSWVPWLLWRMGDGIFPAPMLRRRRMRRDHRQTHPRVWPRRQYGLLHRLPPPRRKIPPRHRHVLKNALHRSNETKVAVGQLREDV